MKKELKDFNVTDAEKELELNDLEKVYTIELDHYIQEVKYAESELKEYQNMYPEIANPDFIKERIRRLENYRQNLKNNRETARTVILNLKNTKKKVFYMQRYLGMSLKEIADELMMDYGYIRKIAVQVNKDFSEQFE